MVTGEFAIPNPVGTESATLVTAVAHTVAEPVDERNSVAAPGSLVESYSEPVIRTAPFT